MIEDVTRREFCTQLGALLSLGLPTSATSTATETEGWITKGDKTAITTTRSTVESRRGFGTNLCDDGERYACQTCDGDTFYLLVPVQSSEPSVGDSYRFEPTGETNFCGDFKVRLVDAESCDGTKASDASTNDTFEGPSTETPTDSSSNTTS